MNVDVLILGDFLAVLIRPLRRSLHEYVCFYSRGVLGVLIRPLRRSWHECFCFDSRGFLGGPYKALKEVLA